MPEAPLLLRRELSSSKWKQKSKLRSKFRRGNTVSVIPETAVMEKLEPELSISSDSNHSVSYLPHVDDRSNNVCNAPEAGGQQSGDLVIATETQNRGSTITAYKSPEQLQKCTNVSQVMETDTSKPTSNDSAGELRESSDNDRGGSIMISSTLSKHNNDILTKIESSAPNIDNDRDTQNDCNNVRPVKQPPEAHIRDETQRRIFLTAVAPNSKGSEKRKKRGVKKSQKIKTLKTQKLRGEARSIMNTISIAKSGSNSRLTTGHTDEDCITNTETQECIISGNETKENPVQCSKRSTTWSPASTSHSLLSEEEHDRAHILLAAILDDECGGLPNNNGSEFRDNDTTGEPRINLREYGATPQERERMTEIESKLESMLDEEEWEAKSTAFHTEPCRNEIDQLGSKPNVLRRMRMERIEQTFSKEVDKALSYVNTVKPSLWKPLGDKSEHHQPLLPLPGVDVPLWKGKCPLGISKTLNSSRSTSFDPQTSTRHASGFRSARTVSLDITNESVDKSPKPDSESRTGTCHSARDTSSRGCVKDLRLASRWSGNLHQTDRRSFVDDENASVMTSHTTTSRFSVASRFSVVTRSSQDSNRVDFQSLRRQYTHDEITDQLLYAKARLESTDTSLAPADKIQNLLHELMNG